MPRLAAIVGAEQVLTTVADTAPYLSDWRGRYRGAARCVVRYGADKRWREFLAQPGQQVDITVSSLGNARSLRGGTLLMTPLKGADGQSVFGAIAQTVAPS